MANSIADMPTWFSQVYEAYQAPLLHFLQHLVGGGDQLAEDLVQDTFVKAWQALPQQDLATLSVRPWLYRIARNSAIDALRRRKLIAWESWEALELDPADGSHADPQDTYLLTGLAGEALRRLPPSYRRALTLATLYGATAPEIAQALGIAQGGVKMYLCRARAAFRQQYQALTADQEVHHSTNRTMTQPGEWNVPPSSYCPQEQEPGSSPVYTPREDLSMLMEKDAQMNDVQSNDYRGILLDTEQRTHDLSLQPADSRSLLLDGHQAAIIGVSCEAVSLRTERTTITVTLVAFWHALMGDEPTEVQAGQLLAETIARWQIEGERVAALCDLQAAVQRFLNLGQGLEALTLPERFVHPFTRQVLERFDGTNASLEAIAFVLKQPQERIVALLRAAGKQMDGIQGRGAPTAGVAHSDESSSAPQPTSFNPRAEAPSSDHLTSTLKKGEQFRWTVEMKRQLEEAFLASTAETNTDAVRAIASRFGWPFNKVNYQVYQLDLPKKKRAMQQHAAPNAFADTESVEEGGQQPEAAASTF